jgi:hypothetical protein
MRFDFFTNRVTFDSVVLQHSLNNDNLEYACVVFRQ